MPDSIVGGTKLDPGEMGEFRPVDFWFIIEQLPENCPIVGGQAVSWWAERFGVTRDDGLPITSSDIDFWGGQDDLKLLASRLKLKPILPHEYEMTVWVGAIQIRIDEKKSLVEFLHTIPGLDVVNPDKATIEQEYRSTANARIIQVLSPVSLIPAKLHCLRHFSQKGRDDELHLRVCLKTARLFLTEMLQQGEIRLLFWNIERLIAAHVFKPYRHLEKSLGFDLLDAIPIEEMRQAAAGSTLSADNRQRLARFLDTRWPQATSGTEG